MILFIAYHLYNPDINTAYLEYSVREDSVLARQQISSV